MRTIRIHQTENAIWLNKDYGIRSNVEFLKNNFLQKQKTVKNLAATIFREFAYSIKAILKNVILTPLFPAKCRTLLTEKTEKQALIIFFHGLNGKPSVWDNHISKFNKISKKCPQFNVQLFAPKIPKRGHCTLKHPELIAIYDQVVNWANNNPGKPIVIFGHSYGSRIGLRIETFLRKRAPGNPVLLTLSGGVLYGTSKIQGLTKKISAKTLERLTLGLMTSVACEELALESNSSKKLLKNARKPLKEGVAKRCYRKYAALYDSHIKEMGSSLPILTIGNQKNKNEKDYVVNGYGHNSLVDAVSDRQVQKCYRWINKIGNL